MRMYPDYFSTKNTSNAEKRLFNLFKSMEVEGFTYCLHSQNLKWHKTKRVAEIDFLLLGEKGLLILEVKGGRVREVHSGGQSLGWEFMDGSGNTNLKHEGPFEQAQGAMFALENLLQQDVQSLKTKPVVGYGVVFPDQIFSMGKNAPWDQSLVIDSNDFIDNNFRLSIQRVFNYWSSKTRANRNFSKLSPQDVAAILKYCRPVFEQVETLRSLSNSFETALVELSAPSLAALDLMSENKRLLISGGAGTGKTLLAMNQVERLLSNGKKVLFTAKNQNIVDLFETRFSDPNLTAISFGRLKLWNETRIDALVMDEAQDLANFRDLDVVDRVLEGGLEKGNWLICLDPNLQAGIVGSFEDESFEYLKGIANSINLNKNVRNTPAIVKFIERRLDIKISELDETFGRSPDVLAGSNSDELIKAAEGHIENLIDQGIELQDIVLLSSETFSNSIFSRFSEAIKAKISDMDMTGFMRRPKNRILFSSVNAFKGLEAKYVIYESVDIDPLLMQKTEYLALTRARHGLAILDNRGKK